MHKLACLLVGLAIAGCKSLAPDPPRYIVTKSPFDWIGPRHPGICVAVDPADPKGVWWWDSGRDGCRSASSSVMPGGYGKVTPMASGAHEIHFEIGMMSGGPMQIDLRLDETGLRRLPAGAPAPVERRASLELPGMPPSLRTPR